MKPTIIQYPIPGNDIGGGLLHIYGKRTSRNVILYCGGWPDGVADGPFTPLAKQLATSTEHDDGCFVGITCWPGFDYESYQQTKYKRQGYTFDEVTCCIREAAKQLFIEYNKTTSNKIDNDDRHRPQFTTIFHDFGVLTGCMFVNRSIEEEYFTEHKPDKVILLDVLMQPHRKSDTQYRHLTPYTNHEQLVYLAYRGTFAISFAVMRYISVHIAIVTFGILYGFVKLLRLEPTRRIDGDVVREKKMNLKHMMYTFYPYYHLFQAFIYNKQALAYGSLPLTLKETPILYMYGSEKNAMFHDRRSLAMLEQEERRGTSDCRVVRIDGAGHWMYHHTQRPDICEQEIRSFINKSRSSSGNISSTEKVNVQSRL